MTPTEALAAYRNGKLSAREATNIIYARGAAPVLMSFEERKTFDALKKVVRY